MKLSSLEQAERLVQNSRFQLWYVLVLLLLIGASDLVDILFPNLGVPHAWVFPISIGASVIGALAASRWNGIDCSPTSPGMQALRNDELRRAAHAKAFRNGFFVLLAYPPLCAFALTGLGVADPLAFVVGSGAWLGAVVFLASVLWHDR
nr:hypothetical protein [uncultured organism]